MIRLQKAVDLFDFNVSLNLFDFGDLVFEFVLHVLDLLHFGKDFTDNIQQFVHPDPFFFIDLDLFEIIPSTVLTSIKTELFHVHILPGVALAATIVEFFVLSFLWFLTLLVELFDFSEFLLEFCEDRSQDFEEVM